MAIDIFITSFQRKDFIEKTIESITERTTPGTYKLHVYDNGSDKEVKEYLLSLLEAGVLTSLHLDNRNTGCNYNKAVFHTLSDSREKYYVVTDNDVLPPDLKPDWLQSMVDIMDRHPDIALLAPQLPPQNLQQPYALGEDVVYCKAVGNTFKLVRREAFPIQYFDNTLNTFGDDGKLSALVHERGWRVAFCRNIFCLHIGQCEDWGYKKEELDQDPRKAGYGKPFEYAIKDDRTYEPLEEELKI